MSTPTPLATNAMGEVRRIPINFSEMGGRMMGGIRPSRPAGQEGRRDQGQAAPHGQPATEPQGVVLAMSETTHALPPVSNGYEVARFNALRHGALSRYTVLGPTEEHLVEEIAGIMWRKRRLRLAEAAAIRRRLPDATLPSGCRWTAERAVAHLRASATGEELVEAVQATPDDTASDSANLAADEDQMLRAIGGSRVLERARSPLHQLDGPIRRGAHRHGRAMSAREVPRRGLPPRGSFPGPPP